MKNKLKEYLVYMLVFFGGALVGWIYESLKVSLKRGHFVNRGFLYGPILPIYGYGAILLILVVYRFRKKPFLVFSLSLLFSSILEYLSGVIMYKIWHHRWWNYSTDFLNINGFVCLRSAFCFGIAGLMFIYIIYPLIKKVTSKMSINILMTMDIIIFVIYLIDNLFSFVIKNSF